MKEGKRETKSIDDEESRRAVQSRVEKSRAERRGEGKRREEKRREETRREKERGETKRREYNITNIRQEKRSDEKGT